VSSLAAGPAAAEEPSDYAVSEEGRRFRVRFDPASRIWAGASVATEGRVQTGVGATLEVDLGIRYRAVYTWGKGIDQIIWQMDHRWIAGRLWPLRREVMGVPGLEMALYGASLHRHDESPSIVLPLSPPVGVPFPFDVGFEMELGRVFVPAYLPVSAADGSGLPMLRVGVLRATAFVDPWRSGRPGRSLEIGVGARYEIEPYANPTLEDPLIVHRVAPGTAGSVRFRYQTDDGLLTLDARGDVLPHWNTEGSWKLMALVSARVERTLLAINDQPITAYVDGGYRRTPETSRTEAADDLRLSVGLAFGLSLR
jgi:hypothetical protein